MPLDVAGFANRFAVSLAMRGVIEPGTSASQVAHLLRTEPATVAAGYARSGDQPGEAAGRLHSSLWDLGVAVPGSITRTTAPESVSDLLAAEIETAGLVTTEDHPMALPVGGYLFDGGITLVEGERPLGRIPEEISGDVRAAGETMRRFVRDEVLPQTSAIEAKDYALQRRLLKRAAELGLLGAEMPEAYGGLDVDMATWVALMEATAGLDSFTVGMTGHMGIGSQPIVKYGTPAQRERYLPAMAAGDCIGAYALTESEGGSDAFGGMRTTARLEGDEWVLDGSKRFITNAGFADLFIVFAKVEGRVTAFIVEKGTPGFTIGREENKLGLKGSSTCELSFSDVHIPRGNLLGRVGEGHKIAMNILNSGRLRLGVVTSAQAIRAVGLAARYAGKERRQFKRRIGDFGAVQHDLASAAIQAFVAQSVAHRVAGDIGYHFSTIDSKDPEVGAKKMGVLERFSIEAAMAKILGSEAYVFAVDRLVQIMGGYGYIEEFEAARLYRDARINPLFEGTNGINRVHQIAGALLRRLQKGEVPRGDYSYEAVVERLRVRDAARRDHPLSAGVRQANRAEELAGYAYDLILRNDSLRALVMNVGDAETDSRGQFLALCLAELAMGAYAINAVVQRALKLVETRGADAARVSLLMAQLFAQTELRRMLGLMDDLIGEIFSVSPTLGAEATMRLGLLRLNAPLDRASCEREIATHLLS